MRRNFAASLTHGIFGMTGFRLIYAPTIIPAYIHLLTGSSAAVGMGTALLQFGGTISPIASGARIESRSRVLPYAICVGSMMRVMILGLALAAWLLTGGWLVGITFALFLALGFFSGAQRVAFQMLMAKVIPLRRRGRLQGIRNLVGEVIAAGLAWFAGHVLIDRRVHLGVEFGNRLTDHGRRPVLHLVSQPDPGHQPSQRARDQTRGGKIGHDHPADQRTPDRSPQLHADCPFPPARTPRAFSHGFGVASPIADFVAIAGHVQLVRLIPTCGNPDL